MSEIGIALVALGVGGVAGAVLALWVRWAGGHGAVPGRLEARLETQAAEIRRLADAARGQEGAEHRLWAEVSAARRVVEDLRTREEDRRERDRHHAEVVARLSTVLAGGSAKGRAGENVLREQLGELPPGMLVSDFRVNGRVVEYGLLLPDGRRLPVDSKWSAVREIEALEAADDPTERELLARDIERIVAGRAREVAAYLDPGMTAPVAVAAVPDAAYGVLRRAHAEAFRYGVVIVPYSAALPVLLFLYSLVSRYGSSGDVQGCLGEVASMLEALEQVLENKLARATTMLANGTDEIRSQLGKARGSIARARAGAAGVDGGSVPLPLEGGDALHVVPAMD
jgi:hypothetical protein